MSVQDGTRDVRPNPEAGTAELPPARRWLTKLTEGIPDVPEREVEVVGRLPAGLTGTLYRNGPGLYERAGYRKWNLLDGDGLIRATDFAAGKARFRARFVRTRKYETEERAGRFLYPTWTTPAPGWRNNVPGYPRLGQAGVTPLLRDGVLLAFDEVGLPYGLDPRTLDTTGLVDPMPAGAERGPEDFKAHSKIDGPTGDWVLVGSSGRVRPELHALVRGAFGPAGRPSPPSLSVRRLLFP